MPACVAVSITKDRPWRGGRHEFSNVYHYTCSAIPDQTAADALIDELVSNEQPAFDANVSFKRGRVWWDTGDPNTSTLVHAKDLSAAGTGGTSLGHYGELAVLCEWPLPRGARGVARRLKKFLHSQIPALSPAIDGAAQITGAALAPFTTYIDAVSQVNAVSPGVLCAPAPKADVNTLPGYVFPWMEHHQFGR